MNIPQVMIEAITQEVGSPDDKLIEAYVLSAIRAKILKGKSKSQRDARLEAEAASYLASITTVQYATPPAGRSPQLLGSLAPGNRVYHE